jgi:hypothetical protein
MSRSNFGQQVQEVVSKIDTLFHPSGAGHHKSGSVVYQNRLSTMQTQDKPELQPANQVLDSGAASTPALFDAIQSL